jgi:hypothetical protein
MNIRAWIERRERELADGLDSLAKRMRAFRERKRWTAEKDFIASWWTVTDHDFVDGSTDYPNSGIIAEQLTPLAAKALAANLNSGAIEMGNSGRCPVKECGSELKTDGSLIHCENCGHEEWFVPETTKEIAELIRSRDDHSPFGETRTMIDDRVRLLEAERAHAIASNVDGEDTPEQRENQDDVDDALYGRSL